MINGPGKHSVKTGALPVTIIRRTGQPDAP